MEEFYTIKEVANKLKVHWKTIYRWIQEDKIKATKFGRDWKISQEEIDFIKNNGLRN
ncbi:MAG: helix-turn-helix domain-containing protein [Clostridia bacterium]|nr:helix-turn-helix domain-containing protein [Clostridia bacterium]